MPRIHCDILICGAGTLGLWLANQLKSRYSVVVAESELIGSGQTRHSQAFLHQGYFRADNQWARKYAMTWPSWQSWLGEVKRHGEIPGLNTKTYYAFSNPSARDFLVNEWFCHGLKDYNANPSDSYGHCWNTEQIQCVATTPEFCTESEWLLQCLYAGVAKFVITGASVTEIASKEEGFSIKVCYQLGENFEIDAKAVVVATGDGGIPLLQSFDPDRRRTELDFGLVRKQKWGYVLAIQSNDPSLPFVNIAAPEDVFDYLFIVSRRPYGPSQSGVCEKGTVWLVSDDVGWVDRNHPLTGIEWVTHIRERLFQVINPTVLKRCAHKWGLYCGTKIDPAPSNVTNEVLQPYGLQRHGIDGEILQVDQSNFYVGIPSRLSRIPQTAATIEFLVSKAIPPSNALVQISQDIQTQIFAAPRFVDATQLLWNDFMDGPTMLSDKWAEFPWNW